MLYRVPAYLTAAIMAAGMMACGGSSSGTTPVIVPPPPAAYLPITPANAADITGDVIDAVSSLFNIVSITDVTNLPFPDLPFAQATLAISLSQPLTTRSLIVDSGSCDTGGFTTNWDDVDDNLEVSTGDTVDFIFNACHITEIGVTIDGDMFVTSLEISGDPNGVPPWSVAANFACSDLAGADNAGTSTINGTIDFSISSLDGETVDMSVSGTELVVVQGGSTDRIRNFAVSESLDTNSLMITIDASGTLTRQAFNGTVSFATPVSLVILGGDDNPSSGQIRITHATSNVLVTVLDNVNVQLAIDANGDGTAETTQVVTWADLQSG